MQVGQQHQCITPGMGRVQRAGSRHFRSQLARACDSGAPHHIRLIHIQRAMAQVFALLMKVTVGFAAGNAHTAALPQGCQAAVVVAVQRLLQPVHV